VVGRTGAGKSSLIGALFRLTEIESGLITVDHVNTKSLGLKQLRAAMALIPQVRAGMLLKNDWLSLNMGHHASDTPLCWCRAFPPAASERISRPSAASPVPLISPAGGLVTQPHPAALLFVQVPVLFTGSIRENLAPFGGHSDSALWSALRRAHLAPVVEDWEAEGLGGLDFVLGEGGSPLSAGQKQLLALARALLNPAKVSVAGGEGDGSGL
jgi:ABC-type transport system involved in cytochrome bd biosynthesis fused ATPase/permease subunit